MLKFYLFIAQKIIRIFFEKYFDFFFIFFSIDNWEISLLKNMIGC